MLYLLFQLGNDRYAIPATDAVEVIPYLLLKKIPQAPRGLAGLFNYRGRPAPAVDLCDLTFGRPASERLNTRIIVATYADAEGRDQLVGLIAERATEILRRDASQFIEAGRTNAAPYLGPVLMDERGVIQMLKTQNLLGESARELLSAQRVEPSHEPG